MEASSIGRRLVNLEVANTTGRASRVGCRTALPRSVHWGAGERHGLQTVCELERKHEDWEMLTNQGGGRRMIDRRVCPKE